MDGEDRVVRIRGNRCLMLLWRHDYEVLDVRWRLEKLLEVSLVVLQILAKLLYVVEDLASCRASTSAY